MRDVCACVCVCAHIKKGRDLLQGTVEDSSSTINSILGQLQFMIATEIVGVICASKSVCHVHKLLI